MLSHLKHILYQNISKYVRAVSSRYINISFNFLIYFFSLYIYIFFFYRLSSEVTGINAVPLNGVVARYFSFATSLRPDITIVRCIMAVAVLSTGRQIVYSARDWIDYCWQSEWPANAVCSAHGLRLSITGAETVCRYRPIVSQRVTRASSSSRDALKFNCTSRLIVCVIS